MESRQAHLVSGLGYLPRISKKARRAAYYGTEDVELQRLLQREWSAENTMNLYRNRAEAREQYLRESAAYEQRMRDEWARDPN